MSRGSVNVIGSITIAPYTTRIYPATGYTYICKAPAGSPTSSPVWQIARIDAAGSKLFALGTAEFDQVADDYATLAYF